MNSLHLGPQRGTFREISVFECIHPTKTAIESKRKRSYAAFLTALLLMCVWSNTPAQDAHIMAAAGRAVLYLQSIQNSDGSWDEYSYTSAPMITATVTLALLNSGVSPTESSLGRALTYLLAMQRSDGAFSSTFTTHTTHVTSLCMLAAIVADTSTNREMYTVEIQKGRQYLLEAQDTDGGWGPSGQNHISDQLSTLHALLALHYAADYLGAERPSSILMRASDYLDQTQSADGGFGSTSDDPTVGITSTGLWSYALCGRTTTDPRTEGTLKWIKERYDPVWGSDVASGDDPYFSGWALCQALQALGLRLLPSETGFAHDYVRDVCSDFLISRQSEAGFWLGSTSDNQEHALATARALLTLSSCYGLQDSSCEHVLRITLESPNADLHVWDAQGRHVGKDFTGQIVRGITSTFTKDVNRQTVELHRVGNRLGDFQPGPHHIEIQSSTQDIGNQVTVVLLKRRTGTNEETTLSGSFLWSSTSAGPGDSQALDISLLWTAGPSILSGRPLGIAASPLVSPSTVEITVQPGETAEAPVIISETLGQEDISSISIAASDLVSLDSTHVIDSGCLRFNKNISAVPAGTALETSLVSTLPATAESETYTGSLLIEMTNAGARSVPLTLATPDRAFQFHIYPPRIPLSVGREVQTSIVVSKLPPQEIRSLSAELVFDSMLLEPQEAKPGTALLEDWAAPTIESNRISISDAALRGGHPPGGVVASVSFHIAQQCEDFSSALIELVKLRLVTVRGDTLAVPAQRIEPAFARDGSGDYLACDFNSDGGIDFEDLMIFTAGWLRQDPSCDVGPVAEGTEFPNPIPVFDGRVGVEDLLVFAHMWDWYQTKGLPKRSASRIASTIPKPTVSGNVGLTLTTQQESVSVGDTVTITLEIQADKQVLGVSCSVSYDAQRVNFLGSPRSSQSSPGFDGIIRMPTLDDDESGLVEINAGFVGQNGKHQKPLLRVESLQFVVQASGDILFAIESADVRTATNQSFLLPANLRQTSVVCISSGHRSPKRFELLQNSPNPFNNNTRMVFSIPAEKKVCLQVFDVLGRLVVTLLDKKLPSGKHTLTWNGRDSQRFSLPSGVYFCRLQSGEHVAVRKLMIAR